MSKTSNHAVIRGFFSLMMGSGTSKLLGIFSLPLLTRLYSVEEIGTLTVVNSFVMLAAPLLTLRYVVAIPLPRTDAFAMHLLLASLLLSIGVSVFMCLGLIVLHSKGLLLEMPGPADQVLWLVPPLALGMAIQEIFTTWLIRKRQYGSVARIQMAQVGFGEGSKVLLGFAGWKSSGLLLGQLLFQLLGVALSIRESSNKRGWVGLFKKKWIGVALWRYRSVPLFRLPGQLCLIFSMQAPLLFSAWMYSASEAGLVGMAVMAITMPFTLIGQAASRVYYSEISRLGRRNPVEIQRLTFYISKRLFLISIPITALIFLLGESVFAHVFGPQWGASGRLAAIMSLYLALQFAASPLLDVFNVFDAQSKLLTIHVQRAILITAAFFISHVRGLELEQAIKLYSSALSIHYIWTVIRIHMLLRAQCARVRTN